MPRSSMFHRDGNATRPVPITAQSGHSHTLDLQSTYTDHLRAASMLYKRHNRPTSHLGRWARSRQTDGFQSIWTTVGILAFVKLSPETARAVVKQLLALTSPAIQAMALAEITYSGCVILLGSGDGPAGKGYGDAEGSCAEECADDASVCGTEPELLWRGCRTARVAAGPSGGDGEAGDRADHGRSGTGEERLDKGVGAQGVESRAAEDDEQERGGERHAGGQ